MSWRSRRRPSLPRAEDADTAAAIEPGVITALTGQTHDPERLNLSLNGSFAFGVAREVALRENLRLGDELDADRIQTLRAADEVARATNAGVVFLTYRARSEREVRDRLAQKGYPPAAIEPALQRLLDWGYLNDADFARFWTENRLQHKPRGRRLLEQELRHKGVDREVVRATLDEAALDDEATALALAQDRLRRDSDSALEPAVRQRRLAGFLARRGYSYDVIKPVLRRLFADEATDE